MTNHRQVVSAANPIIKNIRKLKQKKYRKASGEFFIEGLRVVSEALRTKQSIQHIIFCPEMLTSQHGNELIHTALKDKLDVVEVSKQIFLEIAEKDGPQGLAAVVQQKWHELALVASKGGIWVALESVQDPGNLGSILRSSDAAGAKGVILLGDGTDPFHPTSVRASMGAIFNQAIIKSTFDLFLEFKRNVGIEMIGTISQEAQNYRHYNYTQDMILLMGSEQKGLSKEYLDLCDVRVHIPMMGSVDSLNLSNAASIILFEIMNQLKRND